MANPKAMKRKLYFENEDATICYPEEYFKERMESDGLDTMDVLEAIPEYSNEFYWCSYFAEAGERGDGNCGKFCKKYSPRNGKNGCCKHYTTKMYLHGEKITLTT